MTYKRPEDQYKIPQAREMIKEISGKGPCRFSTVRPYQRILYHDVEHAGTLVHVCILEKGHEGLCKCADPCGVEWQGWE